MACQHVPKKYIALILCLLLGSFCVAGTTSPSLARNALGVAAKGSVTAPTITTASLPAGHVGAPYMGPLSATGGLPPYVWTVIGNGPKPQGLPAGLQLSSGGAPGSKAIAGTPSVIGMYPVVAIVRDRVGNIGSKQLSIAITYSPLTVATGSLPAATMNVPYSATLVAQGGRAPYAWSRVSGNLAGRTYDVHHRRNLRDSHGGRYL